MSSIISKLSENSQQNISVAAFLPSPAHISGISPHIAPSIYPKPLALFHSHRPCSVHPAPTMPAVSHSGRRPLLHATCKRAGCCESTNSPQEKYPQNAFKRRLWASKRRTVQKHRPSCLSPDLTRHYMRSNQASASVSAGTSAPTLSPAPTPSLL